MTLDETTIALQRLLRLRDELANTLSDFTRRDDVLQHLEWGCSHLAEQIWQKALHNEV